MHLCRNAWQKLAPLTYRGAGALLRNASVRQMSSSVPGSSGEALPYYLLVGVAFAGGGFYAYRTVSRDKERFHERHEYINTQLKPALADYGRIFPSPPPPPNMHNIDCEKHKCYLNSHSYEQYLHICLVEPEKIESVEETLEEISPVLEASSDNITEDLASAAEDWSELTARKPELIVEESAPPDQESEEAVESEEASASS
ncbi:protein MGARP [Rhinoderma darwinii]|uniref:protein MGARP n=1 Tax=Rhinoderma darwinii TaxID=43563 RepID=UPI003F66ACBD